MGIPGIRKLLYSPWQTLGVPFAWTPGLQYVCFPHWSGVLCLVRNTKNRWFVNTLFIQWHMGWLRFVGSSKLQISFAMQPYKIDDILQKRPIIFKEPTNRSRPIASETHCVMYPMKHIDTDTQTHRHTSSSWLLSLRTIVSRVSIKRK